MTRMLVDEYYVTNKPITLPCISFMFNRIKFIHCHYCVMFAMKSTSICDDSVNYEDITISQSYVFKHMY